eukprot:192211_1
MSTVAKRFMEDDSSEMTPSRLIKICRKKGLYETPQFNDSLYLNHEGFESIKNLEPYSNLKSLFLEANLISKIENISHLTNLRGLYLQKNVIQQISNLDGLCTLNSLDLSNNQIKSIQNMSHLKNLETLNLANNLISTADDLAEIVHNTSISTLYLTGNKFKTEKEGMKLIELLSELPNLRSLYLKGNECINQINFYRKHTLSHIRTLTFLDERPVFENERRLTDAWVRGGRVEEDKERQKIRQEKIDKRNLTRKTRREQYEARKKAMFERIEREQKENEMKDQESEQIGDDVSEESKEQQRLDPLDDDNKDEATDDMDSLPGMVNRHLSVD